MTTSELSSTVTGVLEEKEAAMPTSMPTPMMTNTMPAMTSPVTVARVYFKNSFIADGFLMSWDKDKDFGTELPSNRENYSPGMFR